MKFGWLGLFFMFLLLVVIVELVLFVMIVEIVKFVMMVNTVKSVEIVYGLKLLLILRCAPCAMLRAIRNPWPRPALYGSSIKAATPQVFRSGTI
jgi:hypothetical protein